MSRDPMRRGPAALLLAATLMVTGCPPGGAPTGGSGGGGSAGVPPATSGGGRGSTTPGTGSSGVSNGSGTQTPAPPPVIAQPGPRPVQTPPPSSTLPPPTSSQQLVQEIRDRWGVPVTGAGATIENLETVKRGLEEFLPEHTRGSLTRLDLPVHRGLQSLQGYWQTFNGRTAEITVYAQTGRPNQVGLHTVAHEVGHHMTLLSRKSWGTQFDRALGTGSGAYATDYSRTSSAEKMAESLSMSLLGADSDRWPYRLRSWNPSTAARSLVNEEFGARVAVP